MNKRLYYLLMILLFSTLSVIMYSIQTLLFHDPTNTIFYLFQDLAFVPVQALIATLLLNRFVDLIQRMQSIKKIHVIVSAFFSELGTAILCMFAELNDNNPEFTDSVDVMKASAVNETRKVRNDLKRRINEFPFKINVTPERLTAMSQLLVEKKSFMIGMLENSSLMEHDSFTDMLWAVFHVADELQTRDLEHLGHADFAHLNEDILRAYRLLLFEWIGYIRYLRTDYPYLYHIAMRKGPFQK